MAIQRCHAILRAFSDFKICINYFILHHLYDLKLLLAAFLFVAKRTVIFLANEELGAKLC